MSTSHQTAENRPVTSHQEAKTKKQRLVWPWILGVIGVTIIGLLIAILVKKPTGVATASAEVSSQGGNQQINQTEESIDLLGAQGSFKSGASTGQGPVIFSLEEERTPSGQVVYVPNQSAGGRGISASPGSYIPEPTFKCPHPEGLRWQKTNKPDPYRPGKVFFVLVPQ